VNSLDEDMNTSVFSGFITPPLSPSLISTVQNSRPNLDIRRSIITRVQEQFEKTRKFSLSEEESKSLSEKELEEKNLVQIFFFFY
jgi:hypothetical protein